MIITQDLQAIPVQLRNYPRWCLWKATHDGRKLFFQVDGSMAKSNDHETLLTFDEVAERYSMSDEWTGVAYTFGEEDPFFGVDLDACRDPVSGEFKTWAREIIDAIGSYTEVSPSGYGVKIIATGDYRHDKHVDRSDRDSFGDKQPEVAIYDRARFWCMTGVVLDGFDQINDAQDDLDALCGRLWPAKERENHEPNANGRADDVLSVLVRCTIVDGNDGSRRLYWAACRCVEAGLSDAEAVDTIKRYALVKPFPKQLGDHQILKRVADARGRIDVHQANGQQHADLEFETYTLDELRETYRELRPPVIDGLIRQGETGNIIAPPKVGKSWMTYGLAYAVATGEDWLGFECDRRRVLILDNELHGETIRHRLDAVADALGIPYGDRGDILVCPLRGRGFAFDRLQGIIDKFVDQDIGLVIVDAWYRMLPKGTSENDNAQVMSIYNMIDAYTAQIRAAWLNVHHASKGMQGDKAVTDVGSGAGAQSRAADTHLVIRAHQDKGVFVLDGAVRSFAPIQPLGLRWGFPLWNVDDSVDTNRIETAETKKRLQRQQDDENDMREIVAALAGGKSLIARELRTATGFGRTKLERLVDCMESDGRIVVGAAKVNNADAKTYSLAPPE